MLTDLFCSEFFIDTFVTDELQNWSAARRNKKNNKAY